MVSGVLITRGALGQAPGVTLRPGMVLSAESLGCSAKRRSEAIDGQSARIFDTDCSGGHHTGASWSELAIYLRGEAEDARSASLQWQVYRTVRFVSQSAR